MYLCAMIYPYVRRDSFIFVPYFLPVKFDRTLRKGVDLNTLKYTATRNNVPQHTATHCNALQLPVNLMVLKKRALPAIHCKTLQGIAIRCNTLQHTATHCSTLQHTATHCNTLKNVATLGSKFQYTTPHRITLDHTGPRCNTLKHTATHCNYL